MNRGGGPRYGVDAPAVMATLWAGAVLTTGWSALAWALNWWVAPILLVAAVFWLLVAGSYTYTTRRGKFRVWAGELDRLALAGDERVVDLGCGRGAVLLEAARRLGDGRALGVDLWRHADQSGNAEAATRANAEAAGVADRVDLLTGDLRALPLPDACAEVVLSSIALHGIQDLTDRDTAVREAYRVLAPGGRLRIADFRNGPRYAEVLAALGAADVRIRSLGPRFWYGGPWFGTTMVSAEKPR